MSAQEQWASWRTIRTKQDELWRASTPAAQRPPEPPPAPPADLLARLANPERPK